MMHSRLHGKPFVGVGCLPSSLSTLYFEISSPVKPGARWAARTAGQQFPGILLFLPPQVWGYRCMVQHPAFLYEYWFYKIRSSSSSGKHLADSNILSPGVNLNRICVFPASLQKSWGGLHPVTQPQGKSKQLPWKSGGSLGWKEGHQHGPGLLQCLSPQVEAWGQCRVT